MAEAQDVIARLRGKPEDDAEVQLELQNIKEALEVQNLGGDFKMRELFTNGPSQNLRRNLLGIAAQFFQQITGINLITVSTVSQLGPSFTDTSEVLCDLSF